MGALIFLLVRGLELLRCMITPGPQQLGSASRAQTDAFYIEPNILKFLVHLGRVCLDWVSPFFVK